MIQIKIEMGDRGLDLLVAQHVFGKDITPPKHADMFSWYPEADSFRMFRCTRCDATWNSLALIEGDCPNGVSVQSYSTDGNHMLAVIEKMRERGWIPHVLIAAKSTIATFLIPNSGGASDQSQDPSAPRAVAIAALRALGVAV